MPLLPRVSNLWRNLFHKFRKDQELTEEIDAYLEMLVEQKISEGLDPAKARRAALIEFGGKEQVKEKIREVSAGHQLETLLQDLRYGLRMLGRNPGFASVAVLSLALGIGANTAIFSLLDAVLLKMLPVKKPEQLVFLERGGGPPSPKSSSNITYPFFEQLRAQNDALAGVCTFVSGSMNVMSDGQAEVAQGQRVSGGFFTTLGVNALLGRTINEEDDKVPGAHPVVVISHHYWRRRFASDPAIVGKRIALNGHPFTIIGVTPPDFFGVTVGEAPALWAPMMMSAQLLPGLSIEQYFNGPLPYVLARLKPGVTEQQARATLTELWRQSLAAASGAQLSPERQQALRQQSIVLTPASHGLSRLRAQFSEPLRILMTVVGLILLIACANVANLLLARATVRKKEIAVRRALGAGRLRLIRQLLIESMLLAGAGGALGLLFAGWGSSFLLTLVVSGPIPVFLNVTLDVRMLGFTAAVSLLAGILFGLAPAWRATRVDLTPALKDDASYASGGSRFGLGKALVIAQVALSLLLLICAGLFVRSLGKLKSLDAGFNKENVLLVFADPKMIGYQGRQIAELSQRLLERIKAIPGVRSASFATEAPLTGGGQMSLGNVYVEGRLARPDDGPRLGEAFKTTPSFRVGAEYFETVGIRLLRGRGFTAQDNEQAPEVAVINESFARYYFGDEDPLGKRFTFNPNNPGGLEIVGVVKDAKHTSLREQIPPTYYVPILQSPSALSGGVSFQIRAAADPTQLIAAVRQAMGEIEVNLPILHITTLAAVADASLAQERLIGALSGFFGLLALLLTCVGLYGIMAYAVSQRTRELGIRMALGAQRSAVLQMVLWQCLKLVALGVGLGLTASFAATRLVASMLFGVTPTDPVTFVCVPSLLLIVALLACIAPARQATKVDPLVALRCE